MLAHPSWGGFPGRERGAGRALSGGTNVWRQPPGAGIWELCLLPGPHQMDGHGFLLGAGISEGFPADIIHLGTLSAH